MAQPRSYIATDTETQFHPPANIQKMSSGIPLTDEDRWDWLTALREESVRQVQAGPVGVVLTCSALKQKYRDVIRVAGYRNRSLRIHFLYLSVTEELLLSRVRARQNHYMSADMVHSQVRILEPPTCAEPDVISIDASGSLEEVQRIALAKVLETMSYE
jgi:gluconokinase